jgi:predicted DNA-binding transcriptional regulator AlpA
MPTDPTHSQQNHERPPRPTTMRSPSSTRRSPHNLDHREHLTVTEICAELKIARSTFYDWRAKGRAPRCLRLPNGDLRVSRGDLDAWLQDCELPPP